MDVRKYLNRIGIDDEDLMPTADLLRRLQHQHLLHVPFENLDIHWKNRIVPDTGRFYEKVVENRRGGFCYELNGLFNELLREIGFKTKLVSARVATGDGEFSREYDHAAIIAGAGGEEYLTDVGFGAFTAEPLKLELGLEQEDATGKYVVREHEDGYLIVLKDGVPEYIFKPIARELTEFAEMCDFHQTSPESHFTRGKVCSLMTVGGRKTLRDNRFIVTIGTEKTETEIGSEQEFDEMLKREFGIVRNLPTK